MYTHQTRNSHRALASLCVLAVVLFLWTGSASASIGRTQGFTIGAMNEITWGGGIGTARGENQGTFSQVQRASDRWSNVSISQVGRGTLNQTASAGGAAPSVAQQTARIRGNQNLLADTCRPVGVRAHQDLGARLTTRLIQPCGAGNVSGTQTYSGTQEQASAGPFGTSNQSQSVDIKQSASITTPTCVDPIVKNTINISLHQSQATQGW
jgi:hypothetical protein